MVITSYLWLLGSEGTWCMKRKRRAILDRLPGLLLKAAVDGLGDGCLHQVNIAHHQGQEGVLQVPVEHPVAQESWRERKRS